MPTNIDIDIPRGLKFLKPETLRQDVFSTFGNVVENPAPTLVPSSLVKQALPPNAVQANQGSALKYLDVTHMIDLYGSAPSHKPARVAMNMFVCAPRLLLPSHESNADGLFPVEILERHPYTPQTFIPLGLSPSDQEKARYLVIVAPSLPPSTSDEKLPVPASWAGSWSLPGRGLPDLRRMKAFMAKGSQAVTYGPGTWHAPMVVVGKKPIDFVVVQFANGVSIEDCQEAGLRGENGSGISVLVPKVGMVQNHGLWKL